MKGQTQTHAFKSQRELTGVPSEHQCCTTTQARKLCRNLEQPLFIMTVVKTGEKGNVENKDTKDTHTHTPMVSVCSENRDGDKNDHQALSSRNHKTMDVDGDGATANPCISKDSERCWRRCIPTPCSPPPPLVNTKGRAFLRSEGAVVPAREESGKGNAKRASHVDEQLGRTRTLFKPVPRPSIPSSHGRGKKRSPNQRPKIRPKRRWLALPNPSCRSLRSKAKAGNPLRRPQSPRNPIRTRWPRLAERRAECF